MLACHATPGPKWPAPWGSEILSLCWDDAHTYAPAAASCAKPWYVEWDKVPLVVTSDKYTRDYAMMAVSVWNEWLGFEALTYKAIIADPDIVLMYGGPFFPPRPTVAGLTMFQSRKQPDGTKHDYAWIAIFDIGMGDDAVFLHEIGHAIGLSHDEENPRSIMYPNAGQIFAPGLETRDRALLRRRYAYLRPKQ